MKIRERKEEKAICTKAIEMTNTKQETKTKGESVRRRGNPML